MATSITPSHPDSSARKPPQKKSASSSSPAMPGTPNPGDVSSASSPRKPSEISSDATTGLVRKRTNRSARLYSTVMSSAPVMPSSSSASVMLAASPSAYPH